MPQTSTVGAFPEKIPPCGSSGQLCYGPDVFVNGFTGRLAGLPGPDVGILAGNPSCGPRSMKNDAGSAEPLSFLKLIGKIQLYFSQP